MKIYLPALLIIPICCLLSCTGPRNIYSSSPYVSPVPMEKGATAIEAIYFSHANQPSKTENLRGHDNCFGLNVSHMLKERTLVLAFADVKKERNQFHDSIATANDPYFYQYNANFDSSVVFGKRYAVGAGVEFFSKGYKKISSSHAALLGLHHYNMNESGLLGRIPYQRFYKVNQLSFSLQQNFLLKVSSNFNLAWIARLTIFKNFRADTDYSFEEKRNASLLDKRVYGSFSHIGFYADYQPLKKIPIYITGQFFNDWSMYKDRDPEIHPNEVKPFHVKGTGVSTGLKYIFK